MYTYKIKYELPLSKRFIVLMHVINHLGLHSVGLHGEFLPIRTPNLANEPIYDGISYFILILT